MDVIKAVRNIRNEMNVPHSKKSKIYIATNDKKTFVNGKTYISKLAFANEIEVAEDFNLPEAITIITNDAKIYIPMDELVDKKEEIERLSKELEKAEKELEFANNKLNNQGFINKAPEKVIEGVKNTAKKMSEKIELIKSTLKSLK